MSMGGGLCHGTMASPSLLQVEHQGSLEDTRSLVVERMWKNRFWVCNDTVMKQQMVVGARGDDELACVKDRV